MKRRAFTLVELVLAIFVLGIGMISIAALFPAGMAQQQAAEDDVYGPIVAKQAMEILRSRLTQEDFGSYEDFTPESSTDVVRDPLPLSAAASANPKTDGVTNATTISGDWSWKRPGLILADNASTTDVDEQGMYDIFSNYFTRLKVSRPVDPSTPPQPAVPFSAVQLLTELPSGFGYVSGTGNSMYGIPYNRQKYDEQRNVAANNYAWRISETKATGTGSTAGGVPKVSQTASQSTNRNALCEPAIFISQRDRYWPTPSTSTNGGAIPLPKYVWDCMFRKANGRVQVAVFVYRVGGMNGVRGGNAITGTPYVVASTESLLGADITAGGGSAQLAKGLPALPQLASNRAGSFMNLQRKDDDVGSPNSKWGAGGLDGKVGSSADKARYAPGRDDSIVPGTEPAATAVSDESLRPLMYSDGWQAAGQSFVDLQGNVLRVLNGRRTRGDGPVQLTKPVPRSPFSQVLIDVNDRNAERTAAEQLLSTPGSGGDSTNGIQDIWFIPLEDVHGNELFPVFVAVEELSS